MRAELRVAAVATHHFNCSKMCHSMAKADSKMRGGRKMLSIRCASICDISRNAFCASSSRPSHSPPPSCVLVSSSSPPNAIPSASRITVYGIGTPRKTCMMSAPSASVPHAAKMPSGMCDR